MTHPTHTILMLSGESTIPPYLLVEDDELIGLIKANTPYDQLLTYLEENY